MTRDDVLLSVDELSAGYRKPVVGPVSFEVRAGEVVGLRGPNGVGKSTLLKAMTGSVRVFGGSVQRRPGLRVSHQHQNAVPIDNVPLSGKELLALTGAKADRLPDWIQPLVSQRLDRLSGGQLQFLQLWASLDAPVDLVLLDEPTNNLDLSSLGFLSEILRDHASHPAVIVVSHDTRFLDTVCDRIVNVAE